MIVCRTYMLSITVADVWVIRVGFVIVGIIFAFRYKIICKRPDEG